MCWLDLPNTRVMVTGQGRKRFIWKAEDPEQQQPREKKEQSFGGNNRKDREDTGTEWRKEVREIDLQLRDIKEQFQGTIRRHAGSVKEQGFHKCALRTLAQEVLGEKDSVVKYLWETCMLWSPLGGPQGTLIDFICRNWMEKGKEQRLLK